MTWEVRKGWYTFNICFTIVTVLSYFAVIATPTPSEAVKVVVALKATKAIDVLLTAAHSVYECSIFVLGFLFISECIASVSVMVGIYTAIGMPAVEHELLSPSAI